MKQFTQRCAFLLMVLSIFSLTACETLQGKGNKELLGAGSGAILGGLAGSQIGDGKGRLIATGVGTFLGGLIGTEIGRSLDRADMIYAHQANEQAYSAPIGEPVNWNNPESGNYGTVVPTRDGYSSSGRYCREYQQTIYVGGQQESAYGTACQQPDGSWEIIG